MYFFNLMLYFCALAQKLVNISIYLSFVMHLPEEDKITDRNMQEV